MVTRWVKIHCFEFVQADREDGTKFMGIAGPYKPASTALNFKKYYAYSAYAKVKFDWRKQAQAMIKPLLDNYKN
jgi:hypothetical protein